MGTPMETTFVGRRAEIAQVAHLMRESRLVTLTGLGGVGKTRLAGRVAEEAARDFPDGLWLVELACLTDSHLLPQTVADSLGVADGLGVAGQSARPQEEVLARWLSSRRSLLILDTCEHLVEAVASLADTLLRGAPGLRVRPGGRRVGLRGRPASGGAGARSVDWARPSGCGRFPACPGPVQVGSWSLASAPKTRSGR